ncbi:hypothetical protein FQR65_LT19286 [Abscondita terminalis]|nr:hypothetical protein FQR65_LT19286 [Abscondita terminalis]
MHKHFRRKRSHGMLLENSAAGSIEHNPQLLGRKPKAVHLSKTAINWPTTRRKETDGSATAQQGCNGPTTSRNPENNVNRRDYRKPDVVTENSKKSIVNSQAKETKKNKRSSDDRRRHTNLIKRNAPVLQQQTSALWSRYTKKAVRDPWSQFNFQMEEALA